MDFMCWFFDFDYIGLVVDFFNVIGVIINVLCFVFQFQKLYECDVCCGICYIEVICGYFGVVFFDMRQQRFEYLGGGRLYVNMYFIVQIESFDVFIFQGIFVVIGILFGIGYGFIKFFIEYCILLGFVCVIVDFIYQQGFDCMWFR